MSSPNSPDSLYEENVPRGMRRFRYYRDLDAPELKFITLSFSDRAWPDIDSLFHPKSEKVPQGYYFRNLSEPFTVCPRRVYDPNDMDEVFADCKSVNRASTFKMKNVDELLKAVFHFGEGQKLNIPITHIVPNGIRWLNWFIACCTRSEVESTFRLFFTLFIVQKSTLSPLYEIHFRSEFCAEKLVHHLKSLKGWHPEFIFIKGGDLLDMPNFRLLAIDKHPMPDVRGLVLASVRAFCRSFSKTLQRKDFFDNVKLHKWGCSVGEN
ncbi:hypothetical protein POM88_052383 [Heracleum sosnowskyi]|uniref:Uncharacterized protein n=1 Tax=Heracleum sosnowskyi TaxID=360622 RepID=A0AAD8GSF9_9APIA|nr:hypothetical protein POM88_052383 [Heracleum sosnowskyi]